mmetsp:Transcript_25811/g.85023  ORF Transcript_25811/g.85023 Transcript_25811/m.85023 type:complete len:206 (+) Transcript_25811:1390-2007(+)
MEGPTHAAPEKRTISSRCTARSDCSPSSLRSGPNASRGSGATRASPSPSSPSFVEAGGGSSAAATGPLAESESPPSSPAALAIVARSSLSSSSCSFASLAKTPPGRETSSSKEPFSTTRPSLSTAMLSALRMVDSRCAMTSVVRRVSATTASSAACTTRSLSLSSADVASSSSRIAGCLMTARAMAMRCFWPPDSLPPPRPTWVS